MTTILAIDPGNSHSGWAMIDADTRRPVRFGKTDNHELRDMLGDSTTWLPVQVVIEMVASYGMPVGKEVFDTCVWIGRFTECHPGETHLVYRKEVKLHHCHNSRAKDANITQALVDRFTPGAANHGKGTKNSPGWFYGFKADVWQAYALAVYFADTAIATTPPDLAAITGQPQER